MLKRLSVICLALLLVVVAASMWAWQDYQNYLKTPLALSEEKLFSIKKGSSFNKLVKQLEEENLLQEALYFKLYARQTKKASQIKAGEYLLAPGVTPESLLDILISGRSVSYEFSIIEGSQFKQLLQALQSNQHIDFDLQGLSQTALLQKLGISASHPEGLFLAETYFIERNTKASVLLKRANKMLQSSLDKAWQERQENLPYKNAYEGLIMASIVEKETARADERPIIAGVFTRRMHKKMRLQTDPTVIYGMGDAYKGNIRRKDLRKATPYNTYVIPGLPPTPIAMVGHEAIHAAFNPQEGKALFFVAKGDGSHYFSATLKEHNKAVRQYQLNRRKDYRSSP